VRWEATAWPWPLRGAWPWLQRLCQWCGTGGTSSEGEVCFGRTGAAARRLATDALAMAARRAGLCSSHACVGGTLRLHARSLLVARRRPVDAAAAVKCSRGWQCAKRRWSYGGMVRVGAAAAAPQKAVVVVVRKCRVVRVQHGGWMLWAKALAGVLAGGMTAASQDVVFPVGVSFWSSDPTARGSLGENPV